jgi:hypothetical protein
MNPLFDLRNCWPEISPRMQQARSLGVMADYDGALAPSERPTGESRPPFRWRDALGCISVLNRVTVVVHGCLSAAELKTILGVPRAWYVGHRGLELMDPQGKETMYYGPEDVRFVEMLSDELVRQTDHLAGVTVKRLGPSLRLDYRNADPAQIPGLLETFRSVVSPYSHQLSLAHSPGIVDGRIRGACDEEMGLRYIHRRMLPQTFFYFGGNSAIHDGLRQLRPSGVIVNVGGKSPGSADYTLPGSDEVVEILERIGDDWRKALEESPQTQA